MTLRGFTALSTGLAFAILASGASAEIRSYYCKLDHSTHFQALIEVDAEENTVRAYGDYIAHSYKHPIEVKLSERAEGKTRLRWKVRGLPGTLTRKSGHVVDTVTEVKVTISIRLDLDKTFSSFSFQERVHGGGGWRSPRSGSCKTLTGSIEDYIKS